MPLDPRLKEAMEGPHGARPPVHHPKKREGYAAKPGTGPFGETCHTCRYICGVRGNEYASACSIGKKGPYGARLYISTTADACYRFSPR
jgi:hypothetical protein